jgi:hypothetical protein
MPANSRWVLIQRLKGYNCLKKPREQVLKQFKLPRPECVKYRRHLCFLYKVKLFKRPKNQSSVNL